MTFLSETVLEYEKLLSAGVGAWGGWYCLHLVKLAGRTGCTIPWAAKVMSSLSDPFWRCPLPQIPSKRWKLLESPWKITARCLSLWQPLEKCWVMFLVLYFVATLVVKTGKTSLHLLPAQGAVERGDLFCRNCLNQLFWQVSWWCSLTVNILERIPELLIFQQWE